MSPKTAHQSPHSKMVEGGSQGTVLKHRTPQAVGRRSVRGSWPLKATRLALLPPRYTGLIPLPLRAWPPQGVPHLRGAPSPPCSPRSPLFMLNVRKDRFRLRHGPLTPARRPRCPADSLGHDQATHKDRGSQLSLDRWAMMGLSAAWRAPLQTSTAHTRGSLWVTFSWESLHSLRDTQREGSLCPGLCATPPCWADPGPSQVQAPAGTQAIPSREDSWQQVPLLRGLWSYALLTRNPLSNNNSSTEYSLMQHREVMSLQDIRQPS